MVYDFLARLRTLLLCFFEYAECISGSKTLTSSIFEGDRPAKILHNIFLHTFLTDYNVQLFSILGIYSNAGISENRPRIFIEFQLFNSLNPGYDLAKIHFTWYVKKKWAGLHHFQKKLSETKLD